VAVAVVIAALVACSVTVGIVSWLAEIFARLAGFRFGPINWFLHGLGFLVTLPFVLALLVLTQGLGTVTWLVGGLILLAAMISFIGGGIVLLKDLAAPQRDGFARR
jgi:hypothetical protein